MTPDARVQEIRKAIEDTLLSCGVPDLPNEGDVVCWLERRTSALEGIAELNVALAARERRIEELEKEREEAGSFAEACCSQIKDDLFTLLGRLVETVAQQHQKWCEIKYSDERPIQPCESPKTHQLLIDARRLLGERE